MKKATILMALLASLPTLGFSQTTWTVNNVSTWIEAVNAIRSGDNNKEYAITVTGAISVPPTPDTESTFGSVTGVKITIEGSGTLSPSRNGSLLVIGAGQTIIAKDVTLRGRDANNASMVRIKNGGTFCMEGKASVTGNTFTASGLSDEDVFSGGVVVFGGIFTMQDSASVSGNTNASFSGGGVRVNDGGTFIMRNSASVSGNISNSSGGGVYIASQGTFTMQDNASVSGNTYEGVVVGERGTFTMQGSASVSGNIGVIGGGVTNGGTFTMQDSASVSSNTSRHRGGGVVNYGTFTMQDRTSVSDNKALDFGGGVLVETGTFTVKDSSSVLGNTSYIGGGVFVSEKGIFTMQDSASISDNKASVQGGGVAVYGGTFTKIGGTIYGDDAKQNLKNTTISRFGHAVYEAKNGNWRNTTAGSTMNTNSYGFWLNDGDVVTFPSGFARDWKRSNFDNYLSITENTMYMQSTSSYYVWVLQTVSGNVYSLKRADTANTKTLTISIEGNNLIISGDSGSGSGQDNWNGTWQRQW